MTDFKIISGSSEIVANFDYFIIDLWGVLHDGIVVYPKAKECLAQLKATGKKIAFLSNAPRRNSKVVETLARLEFEPNSCDFLQTSGEASFEFVKNSPNLRKHFYIGPEKDQDLLVGSGSEEVASASQADFALATGFEDFTSTFAEKQAQLDEALAAGIPLICANPDRKVVRKSGEEQICSGLMADYYLEQGGKVINFGKPYPKVYENIFEFFENPQKSKVLCIGDGLYTDILGARNFGLQSLLISGGIHLRETGKNFGEAPDSATLKNIFAKYNSTPNFISPEFSW